MTTEDTQRPKALDALLRSLSATTTPETTEVTEEPYWYALEVLPPKFMHGPFFTFAEGMEPMTLYWQEGPRYFKKNLSWEATMSLCDAARIPHDYWAW